MNRIEIVNLNKIYDTEKMQEMTKNKTYNHVISFMDESEEGKKLDNTIDMIFTDFNETS